MKHTIEELQFAATVRNLAMDLANHGMPAGMPKDAQDDWMRSNFAKYMELALKELNNTATAIKKTLAAQPT